MATFKGLSRTHGSQKGVDAIDVIESYSPVIRAMSAKNAWELGGTSNKHKENIALTSVQARARGGAYTATDIAPSADITVNLKFHGGNAHVDVTDIADSENGVQDVESWYIKQMKQEFIAYSKAMEILLLKGDGQTNNILGLNGVVNGTNDYPDGSSDTRVINAAPYDTAAAQKSFGLNMANTNYAVNIDKFLELMYYADSLVDQGNGKLMFVNSSAYARLQTIARKAWILGEDRGLFGVPVPTWNGIPMIVTVAGAITSTEPDDTATPLTETTSIYIISPGEMRLSLLSNSGLEFWEDPKLQAKQSGQDEWEIRCAWKLQEPNSIIRIRNIKLG